MAKHVFQFTISKYGIDDSFMFSHPPTADDIIRALKDNQKIAHADYHEWYDACIKDIPTLPAWNSARPSESGALISTGGPIDEGTYNFKRYTLIENDWHD